MSLVDQFGREVRKLRISLTDRCNFRCVYCMPEEGAAWIPKEGLLSDDEIVRVARLHAQLGVQKVRLTGGEPLLRPGVVDMVRRLKALDGIESVGMTTNGFYLDAATARALREAALDGVNISLDSLDPRRFSRLARREAHKAVLAGITSAVEAGLNPVKVNVVAMRGVNDDEVVDFLRWSMERPVLVRFIEFMPLDGDNKWERDLVVTADELLEQAATLGRVEPVHNDPTHPARLYNINGGQGKFGIIASVSEPFCATCNRIRLTADGKLRNCLFALDEYDLRPLLRGGAGEEEMHDAIASAVWNKWEGHLINQEGFERPDRAMYSIGG